MSYAFQTFLTEAPAHAQAWMEVVKKPDPAGTLDDTGEIAYIAVLAAVGLESGISFHVKHARELGAPREEITKNYGQKIRQKVLRKSIFQANGNCS